MSALARVTLRNAKVHKTEVLPLSVYNPEVLFQPRPLTRGPAFAFMHDFNQLCSPLGTTLARLAGPFWAVVPATTSSR